MIIARHIETNALYCVFITGMMKMDDSRWEEAVIYKRLPIDLKRGEDTSELYIRPLEQFRVKFEHVTHEEFESITNCGVQFYSFPEMGGKFRTIFGK